MNRSTNARSSSFILHPSSFRRGFTLVEMLTVVVIIGILASFLVVAVQAARKRAKVFAIHQEVMQLDAAVKDMKNDYGDYPPDFTDYNPTTKTYAAVDRWLLRAFPRYYTGANTPSQQMVLDIQNNYGVTVSNPASALVVFLGGVPGVTGVYYKSSSIPPGYTVQNPSGTAIPWRSDGFYADPTCPFGPNNPYPNAGTVLQPRIKAKYEFPGTRVDLSLGSPYFCPPGVTAASPNIIPAPYVYFRAGLDQVGGYWCYGYCFNSAGPNYAAQIFPSAATDYVVPYQKVVPTGNNAVINPPWRNNDTFQIISSGLDGLYGQNRPASAPYAAGRVAGLPQMLFIYPSGGGDMDNITNFIQNGSTLEDELKQ